MQQNFSKKSFASPYVKEYVLKYIEDNGSLKCSYC